LMPLVALQMAIEAYLAHRPELRQEQMAGRSFEEAASILQSDLLEKQTVHEGVQDKLKRLRQANRTLQRALQESEAGRQAAKAELRQAKSLLDSQQLATLSSSSKSTSSEGSVAGMHRYTEEGRSDNCNDNPKAPILNVPQAGVRSKATRDVRCHAATLQHRTTFWVPFVLIVFLTLCVLRVNIIMREPFQSKLDTSTQATIPVPAIEDKLAVDATRSEVARQELVRATISPSNQAFASQLQQLRTGNLDEKQRAAFMLRNFAAESAENQIAIVQAGAIAPLVRLLEERSPGVREEAARALWNLARNNKEINMHNQEAIAQAGAIPSLVRLLSDSVPRVRVVAAAVLNDLAIDNVANQAAIARAGAVAPLVHLLQHDESPALVMSSRLLQSLATNNADAHVALALADAIPALVELLKADSLLAQEQAASTLGSLAAYSPDIQAKIARAGAVVPLVERLEGDMMQGTAARALRNLATGNAEIQVAIANAGAIVPLAKLLEDGMPGVREEAALALWHLARDNVDNQVEIIRAQAAIPLIALLKGDYQEQATIRLLNLGVHSE